MRTLIPSSTILPKQPPNPPLLLPNPPKALHIRWSIHKQPRLTLHPPLQILSKHTIILEHRIPRGSRVGRKVEWDHRVVDEALADEWVVVEGGDV